MKSIYVVWQNESGDYMVTEIAYLIDEDLSEYYAESFLKDAYEKEFTECSDVDSCGHIITVFTPQKDGKNHFYY